MSHKEMSIRPPLFICIYRPYLIHYVEIWGHAGDRLLNPLLLVQKKIVRIITFSTVLGPYWITAPIFLKLRLLPLCKIVLQRTSTTSNIGLSIISLHDTPRLHTLKRVIRIFFIPRTYNESNKLTFRHDTE